MKIINFFLFLLFSFDCFGQMKGNEQSKRLLNNFIQNDWRAKNAIEKKNFYYQNHLDYGTVNAIIKDLYKVYRDPNYLNLDGKSATFVLSKKEKDQIKKKWMSQKNDWDSSLIPNAKLLRLKPLPPNYTMKEAKAYNSQFENKIVASFTKPVFIRNCSICIFFYSDRYSAGFVIMKKQNDKWIDFLRKRTAVS